MSTDDGEVKLKTIVHNYSIIICLLNYWFYLQTASFKYKKCKESPDRCLKAEEKQFLVYSPSAGVKYAVQIFFASALAAVIVSQGRQSRSLRGFFWKA